jgi:cell division protein FtsI/penicillin-binding protein 2
MNPQSGAIFAMASVPNYDPALWQKYDSNFYKNPVVADTYEPGSTFKIVVVAAAINEGKVKSDTICDKCEGPREIGGFTIKTWNNKYYPQSTMAQILEHSDNVGMVYVAEKLGLGRLYNYLQDFGFGKETKIDLQEEASASLRAKKDWKEIDLATASFGQGISVTPIQMLQASAVIANGGNLVQPHLVEKIIAGDRVYEQKHEIKKGVIKKETARIVAEMMFKAVENGEAKRLKPKDLKVAGKTGTAQIPLAGHYDPTKTIASFVGFAPVENPKFVMLVRIDQPSSSQFGSETAAPTFFNIAKELLTYWGISGE